MPELIDCLHEFLEKERVNQTVPEMIRKVLSNKLQELLDEQAEMNWAKGENEHVKWQNEQMK